MRLEWMGAFLDSLRLDPNVTNAALAAGITREYAYQVRAGDPKFATAWDDAKAESVDELETVARKRAVDGSDVLLIFMLKSNRREVYGDKVQQDTTSKSESVQTVIYMPNNGRNASTPTESDPTSDGPARELPINPR